MRTLLALALSALPAFAAPVPKELRRISPLKQLDGKWLIETLDSGDGQLTGFDGYTSLTFRTAGEKLIADLDGEGQHHCAVMIHDIGSNPMRLDLGEYPGSFQFEHGRLRWDVAKPGEPRPANFQSGSGSVATIWTRLAK